MRINRFEDLECWQKAREIAKAVYSAAKGTAFSKDARLIGQIMVCQFRFSGILATIVRSISLKRNCDTTGSSISAMNNIAEGFDSGSDPDFIRYLGYSRNSLSEIQSSLYVALDQNYINQKCFNDIYQEAELCRKLVDGLRRYLRKKKPAN